MNNFLERSSSSALGGPKPKGFGQNSSTAKRSPQSGAPAALPSGGGLPVFEKRVQLKEALPGVARGDAIKEKGANPFLLERALGEPLIAPATSPGTGDLRKSPTPVPGQGTPGKLPRPTIMHRPGSAASPGGASTPTAVSPASAGGASPVTPTAAAGWGRPPQQTGDMSPPYVAEAMMAGGLGSPSLAPIGQGASTRSMGSALPTSQRTSSPSGRMHPNPVRRAELRKADMFHNIDYYGGIGAPDNDRLVKEASWLSTQSWFESLR